MNQLFRPFTIALLALALPLLACGETAETDPGAGSSKAVEAPQDGNSDGADASDPAGSDNLESSADASESVAEEADSCAEVYVPGDCAGDAGPGQIVALMPLGWLIESSDLGQTISSGNQFIEDLQTTGRFVQVRARIQNGGDEATNLTAPKLVDDLGREFETDSDTIMLGLENQCIFESINPGMNQDCAWIYEVPADAAGLKLRATNGEIFGAETYDVPLGLE